MKKSYLTLLLPSLLPGIATAQFKQSVPDWYDNPPYECERAQYTGTNADESRTKALESVQKSLRLQGITETYQLSNSITIRYDEIYRTYTVSCPEDKTPN